MESAEAIQPASACERLLSEQEAIDVLGLKARKNPAGALRWLMRTRRIAYVRLAKGINAFRPSDIAVFVEGSRVPAAGER